MKLDVRITQGIGWILDIPMQKSFIKVGRIFLTTINASGKILETKIRRKSTDIEWQPILFDIFQAFDLSQVRNFYKCHILMIEFHPDISKIPIWNNWSTKESSDQTYYFKNMQIALNAAFLIPNNESGYELCPKFKLVPKIEISTYLQHSLLDDVVYSQNQDTHEITTKNWENVDWMNSNTQILNKIPEKFSFLFGIMHYKSLEVIIRNCNFIESQFLKFWISTRDYQYISKDWSEIGMINLRIFLPTAINSMELISEQHLTGHIIYTSLIQDNAMELIMKLD